MVSSEIKVFILFPELFSLNTLVVLAQVDSEFLDGLHKFVFVMVCLNSLKVKAGKG